MMELFRCVLFSVSILSMVGATEIPEAIEKSKIAGTGKLTTISPMEEKVETDIAGDFDLTTSLPPEIQAAVDQQIQSSSNKNLSANPSLIDANSLKFKENQIESEDLTEDLLKWVPPEYFQKHFPYYLSGYDDDGRPVWITEMGIYPVRQLAEGDDELITNLEKNTRQAALRIIKSIEAQNTSSNEVTEAVVIIDAAGLQIASLAHPRALLLIVTFFGAYKDLITNYLGSCIVINVNYVAEVVFHALRPVLGRVMEKVEIYGTNRAKWIGVLRRLLPDHVIPPWYGGPADYNPVQVYG